MNLSENSRYKYFVSRYRPRIYVYSMPRSIASSKCQLLTCVDKFSGFISAYPLESGSADCVADRLAQHFMTFGPPECVKSDSGSNLLKNSKVKELCAFFGVRTRVSVGYCHQGGGENRKATPRY